MPRLAVALAAAALAAFAAGLAAGSAAAHGPCGCTTPALAWPGDVVRTGPAYRIVMNPPAGLLRGPGGRPELASGYRADAPTREVLRRPRPHWPRRAPLGRFRVPRDMPPGIYFVLIYDGSEGGAHATWDHVQVPDPALSPEYGELYEILAGVARAFPPL